MASRNKKMLAGFGLLGAGLASALWIGFGRWNDKTSRLVERLFRTLPADGHAVVDFGALETLPVPVANYFRLVLKEGQPAIRWARIRQVGQFRARGKDGGWSPFEATQYFLAARPGFVWDADMRLNRLASVRVRDAYVAGNASMQATICTLMPVVDACGGQQLATSALQRYLAEAVWFPTALLPGAGVQWRGIDGSSAVAALSDSGITASLTFHFGDSGEITDVSTPGRYREVNGHYESTPWHGRFHRYRETHGMRIPLEAEAAWQPPGESMPYFKGCVTEVIYDYAW